MQSPMISVAFDKYDKVRGAFSAARAVFFFVRNVEKDGVFRKLVIFGKEQKMVHISWCFPFFFEDLTTSFYRLRLVCIHHGPWFV